MTPEETPSSPEHALPSGERPPLPDHALATGLHTPVPAGLVSTETGDDGTGSSLTGPYVRPSIPAGPQQPVIIPPGYTITGELGRGGMGVVYSAIDDRLKRDVALKMLLVNRRDQQHLIRFLIEAEAMAQVRHPHVVQVFEAGENGGQPFLALEFLPGGTLGARLDQGRVPLRDALRLMLKIARGVEAAHRQGIVHRDLKPGNVMFDAEGEPKVTDFGLAKRGAQDLTATDATMGTPAYMAPEQARGETKTAGPTADVYALGVMLYEMTTGSRPFTAETTVALVYKVIHDAPEPPRKREPSVPRDVEIITLKCLEKEPRSRYADAGQMADDLERFLGNRPISARPVGRLERGVKWVWRNPIIAGSLVTAVIALVGGTGMSLWQARRAAEEAAESGRLEGIASRKSAELLEETKRANQKTAEVIEQTKRANEKTAEVLEQTRRAQEQVTFMRELFNSSDPTGLTGSGLLPAGQGSQKATAAELLLRGASLVEKRFQGTSRSDRLTRAALFDAIGDVSRSLGLTAQAGPLLAEGLRIRRELLPADHPELADSQLHLANWHAEKGDILDAEALYQEILDGHRLRGALETVVAANVQMRLSVLYISVGDPRGEQLARDGLATRERELGETHRETAIGQMVLASALFDAGNSNDAMKMMGKAFGTLFGNGEAKQETPAAKAGASSTLTAISMLAGLGNVNKDPTLASVLEYQTGLFYGHMGFNQMAITRHKKAIDLMRQSLGADHVYTAIFLADLADSLKKNNQPQEAEKFWREGVDVLRKTVGLEHPRAVVMIEAFGNHLAETGRGPEAWALMREVLEKSEKRHGTAVSWRFKLLSAAVRLACETRQFAMAEKLATDALAAFATLSSAAQKSAQFSLANMGWKLTKLPDVAACRKVYAVVFALPDRHNNAESWWTDELNFGRTLAEHKLYKEAEPHLREAVKLLEHPDVKKTKDHEAMSQTYLHAGKVDWVFGRFAEAEARFRSAVAEDLLQGSAAEPFTASLVLIRFLIVRHKYAEALAVTEEYRKRPISSPTSRAWNMFQQSALWSITGRAGKPAFDRKESALADSTVPDIAMYRARAAVVGQGDVAAEAKRLDDLMALWKPGETHEAVLLARAACALVLNDPDKTTAALNRTDDATATDSKSHLRALLKSVANFRKAPAEAARKNLTDEITRAEAFLAGVTNLNNPEMGGYVTSNQLELRWWCLRLRKELEEKKQSGDGGDPEITLPSPPGVRCGPGFRVCPRVGHLDQHSTDVLKRLQDLDAGGRAIVVLARQMIAWNDNEVHWRDDRGGSV